MEPNATLIGGTANPPNPAPSQASADASAAASALSSQQQTPEQKAAADKAAADSTAAADKAAADKVAADAQLTPEQKAAKETADKAATEKAKLFGAPEKYQPFKAPENSSLNTEVMTEFEGVAKELNLSQEGAQKLLDRLTPKIVAGQSAQIQSFVEKTGAEWANASKADKEIGGDNLEVNLGVAKKAMDAFGSPELTKLLNDTRLGNHPEIIRAFVRIGKAISEDGHIIGTKPEGVSSSASLEERAVAKFYNTPAK